MRTLTAAPLVLVLAGLAHCSSDPPAPSTFACGLTLHCTANTEYCEDSAHAGGTHSYACKPLPSSCAGNPCSNCLSGMAGEISCSSITISGIQENTVELNQ